MLKVCGRGHLFDPGENSAARRGRCPVCKRAADARYSRSEKGRERHRRYNRSNKGRARWREWKRAADLRAAYNRRREPFAAWL